MGWYTGGGWWGDCERLKEMIPGSTGYKEAVALTEKEIDSSEVVVRSEGSFDSCYLGERKTSWPPDRLCRARR